MEIENIIWNKNTYQDFMNYLFSIKDDDYALFHKRLLKNDTKVIGIRTPILKNIAKKITKTNYLEFINLNKHEYYEEIILHGLVVTSLKIDFNESLELFDNYIKYIESWASCDTVISNYKLFKKNLDLGFIKIKEYLDSSNSWIVRTGLVLLLDYYINDEYIDKILYISNNIKNDDYYAKMANAWLISMCLVKYYDKTYQFLLKNELDDWTHNKAIQKAIESYRINNKEELKKLKRK